MTKETQEACRDLLCQYQEDLKNVSVRNTLFSVMLPSMLQWVTAWHHGRGLYVAKEEILSESWDTFLYCVDNYVNWNVPLTDHCMRYINWFLSKRLRDRVKEEALLVPLMDEYSGDYGQVDPSEMGTTAILSGIEYITEYRRHLSDMDRAIFDDALTDTTDNRDRYPGSIPATRYFPVKATYRQMIIFWLEKV